MKKKTCMSDCNSYFSFMINQHTRQNGFRRDGDDAITLAPRMGKQQQQKKSLCFTSLHFDGKRAEVNVRARLCNGSSHLFARAGHMKEHRL